MKEINNEINFEFSIGSDVDFEDLIVDIGFENTLVALLTQEDGFENLRIRIYPPKDKEYWNFKFNEFDEILHKAKNRLEEFRKNKQRS